MMPSTNSISKLGLEEAAVKLFQMGIRSATDFQKLCNGQFNGLQGRPADIPSNPMMYFKEISNFKELLKLGQRLSDEIQAVEQSEKIKTDERDVMSYEDLKQLVRKHNVTSIRKWKKALKENKIPGSFPSSPQAYYENFEGWDVFLAPKGARFLEWEDAKVLATEIRIEHGLKNAYDWRWLSRQGHRPANLPSAPDYYYSQFTTWKEFYGFE
ncbi:hypothetical protein [Pseudoalteromonas sp. NGC95]|uniref:hypothetical protein n=1 Tax=Pseudoalteromonas sp. NGC95 TaxID=2792051 RepID=UPI0018CF75D7|nr:hypothetical protein [Pseudoalteromonas sp. NGC95]MBH0017886.1 hypothetical protein [Pseudoalteromonas sp. NGC95]